MCLMQMDDLDAGRRVGNEAHGGEVCLEIVVLCLVLVDTHLCVYDGLAEVSFELFISD